MIHLQSWWCFLSTGVYSASSVNVFFVVVFLKKAICLHENVSMTFKCNIWGIMSWVSMNFDLLVWDKMRNRSTIIGFFLQETIDDCTKFHDNPSNDFQDISLCIKVLHWQIALQTIASVAEKTTPGQKGLGMWKKLKKQHCTIVIN